MKPRIYIAIITLILLIGIIIIYRSPPPDVVVQEVVATVTVPAVAVVETVASTVEATKQIAETPVIPISPLPSATAVRMVIKETVISVPNITDTPETVLEITKEADNQIRQTSTATILAQPTATIVSTLLPATSTPDLPFSSIGKVQVEEAIDLEKLFLETYQTSNSLSTLNNQALNTGQAKVKFESWSPNGEYMLLRVRTGEWLVGRYVTDPPGFGPVRSNNADLWLANTNGMPLNPLAKTVSWNAWSPDNTMIAYINITVNNDIFDNQLWVVKTDGSGRKKLLSRAVRITWLDDHTIIFVGQDDRQMQLINVDSYEVKPFVIDGMTEEISYYYTLSSNKKKIALTARDNFGIIVAEVIKDKAKLITKINLPDSAIFSWSPDGTKLAVSLQCSGVRRDYDPDCKRITIFQDDGTVLTKIDHYPDAIVTWAPDGQMIAFQETNRVYIADVTSGQLRVLYTFSTPDSQNTTYTIHWSPDGNKIGLNQWSLNGAVILSIK